MLRLWLRLAAALALLWAVLALGALLGGRVLPRGAWLALGTRAANPEILVYDTAHGIGVNVSQHPSDDFNPQWSPDATRLIFESWRNGNRQFYLLDLRTWTLTNPGGSSANDQNPVWSPDGCCIAFGSNRDNNAEVYLLDLHSMQVHNISQHPARDYFPQWSTDGHLLTFLSDRSGSRGLMAYEPVTGRLLPAGDDLRRQRVAVADNAFSVPVWAP